jgi:RimJ/RimL family protein N-acetyltransferase
MEEAMMGFHIETARLVITEFDESMVESVHENSLDEDVRRFVPDEVFETVENARETVLFLMDCYEENTGPFVYPVLLKSGENIGYVQAVPTDEEKNEWEIGYHIAKKHTGKGYATEAVKAFLPIITKRLNIEKMEGLCMIENYASRSVMEKCGFTLEYNGAGDYQGADCDVCQYSYRVEIDKSHGLISANPSG